MNHGLARLPELPISTRLIREIHEKLLAGVRGKRMSPGEIRRSQHWIGTGGSSLNNAVFVPPPPHEVERLLSDLEKFTHSEEFIDRKSTRLNASHKCATRMPPPA